MAGQESYSSSTELGTIVVTKEALGEMVLDAVSQGDLQGRIWLANKKGKRIQGLTALMGEEKALIGTDPEDGRLVVEICIIVRFGLSMKHLTDILMEELRRRLYRLTGQNPASITIHIVGTLSRNVAKRDIRITKEYAA